MGLWAEQCFEGVDERRHFRGHVEVGLQVYVADHVIRHFQRSQNVRRRDASAILALCAVEQVATRLVDEQTEHPLPARDRGVVEHEARVEVLD